MTELNAAKLAQYHHSAEKEVGSRSISIIGDEKDTKALRVVGPKGNAMDVTNWAFGQLCKLADSAPADWLKKLPGHMAADNLNFGLQVLRKVSDVKLLFRKPENSDVWQLRAATGPNYGRIWDCEFTQALCDNFGDGQTGRFRMPGTFRSDLKPDEYTKENSTLFSSDRNTFVFLADQSNNVDLPNRRNGQTGHLLRGFMAWNSEVGSDTIGGAGFLFDTMCCKRIIWAIEQFSEIRFRHTSSAPDKWLHELQPFITEYANSSAGPIEAKLAAAQKKKIDDVQKFLTERYNKARAAALIDTHMREEGRPPETAWDIVTAMSAWAKSIPYTDSRVDVEREAGKILELVAA